MTRDDPITRELMSDGLEFARPRLAFEDDGTLWTPEARYDADSLVERWRCEYERGAVRGFAVVQAQGEEPRVTWRP